MSKFILIISNKLSEPSYRRRHSFAWVCLFISFRNSITFYPDPSLGELELVFLELPILLFYNAIFVKKPELSYLVIYGFKIDFAWILRGSVCSVAIYGGF